MRHLATIPLLLALLVPSGVAAWGTTFGDGTWFVGTDIASGTYLTQGGEDCYWSRLARLGYGDNDVIAHGWEKSPAVVTIESTDVAFETTDCGLWERVEAPPTAPLPLASEPPAPSPLTPLTSADPLTAVTAFLDALLAEQWDTLPSLVCAAQRHSVASLFGSTDAATEQLVDMMQMSVTSGTSVTPTETSGSTATVTIDGQLSVQVPDEALRTFFTQVTVNADPSPAPSEIDQFVAQTQASFQALTLAPEVTVVNESGGWLVCSDIVGSLTASLSPTASPLPSSTASPLPVATAAELAAACDGSAVPGAARYAGRVHPLVVVDSWGTIDADSYGINTKWAVDAWPGPIQLVLCVEPVQHPVRVGTCGTYKRVNDGKVGQVNRFRYAQVVHVVVASTGKTLQSKTLYGKPPACGRKVALTSAPPPWRTYGGDVPDGAVNTYAAATSRQKAR